MLPDLITLLMEVLYRVFEFVDLKPVKYEMLPNEDCISDRYYKLKKGIVYTKFNIMTRMLINTKEGEISIKSLVYELTDNSIRIKGKVYIPINSIIEVTYEY